MFPWIFFWPIPAWPSLLKLQTKSCEMPYECSQSPVQYRSWRRLSWRHGNVATISLVVSCWGDSRRVPREPINSPAAFDKHFLLFCYFKRMNLCWMGFTWYSPCWIFSDINDLLHELYPPQETRTPKQWAAKTSKWPFFMKLPESSQQRHFKFCCLKREKRTSCWICWRSAKVMLK